LSGTSELSTQNRGKTKNCIGKPLSKPLLVRRFVSPAGEGTGTVGGELGFAALEKNTLLKKEHLGFSRKEYFSQAQRHSTIARSSITHVLNRQDHFFERHSYLVWWLAQESLM
jgi:hypothetical protein